MGEGAEISRIWATALSLVSQQCLGTVMALLCVSFHLLIADQDLVLSAITIPFDSKWFMLCELFQKLCPVPFPPVKEVMGEERECEEGKRRI